MDIAEIYGEEYKEPEECKELTEDDIRDILNS